MKIALLGYGTVGRGVDQIIRDRVGSVEVARILELPDRLSDPRMTSDYNEIVSDPDIDLVVECMGGVEPAHTFIMRALASGKHVVTSNKAVVAAHFAEFAEAALYNRVSLFIEASVGGGIPWIAGIEKARRIDEISSFKGIMNGTTNYIVYQMLKDGAYAVAVEPVALPVDSLEAHVPSNFNLVTLDGQTVGELKFYGQGAGSLPTGNSIVQDVLDCAAGRRPVYDFSRGLEYAPELLRGDYVLRTSGQPAGSEPFAPGAWLLRDITAVDARAALGAAIESDPSSFMAALV